MVGSREWWGVGVVGVRGGGGDGVWGLGVGFLGAIRKTSCQNLGCFI